MTTVITSPNIFPYVRVTKTSNQSLTNNVQTSVSWDLARYDPWQMFQPGVSANRLYCQVPGLYQIGAQFQWGTSSAGYRSMTFRINGTTYWLNQTFAPIVTATNTVTVNNGQITLNLGDYVEVLGYQNSGGALNVEGASGFYVSEFWAARIV